MRWTDDTVDNEHMNKKKTKICCIFHPQREFDEGSSCESCGSSSDSSSDESENEHESGKTGTPNAYEHQPHYKNQSSVPQD